MSVREAIRRQYQGIANQAASQVLGVRQPQEGWVVTLRKALGMSGAQLARRLGVSRASVSQTEKNERNGQVTIKHMQAVAEALGCRFVYAIVPEKDIETLLRNQARKRAADLVRRASGHMALENQALPKEWNESETERLCNEYLRALPSNFWDER